MGKAQRGMTMEVRRESWDKEAYQSFKEYLKSLAEEKYCAFQNKLIPNSMPILGIRSPKMKEIAKEIAKGNFRSFLGVYENDYMEETMIAGFVIGYGKMNLDEMLAFVKKFLPHITNWAICDSCVMNMKSFAKNREGVWDFLYPYLSAGKDYEVRFAVVAMLAHFMTEEYIDRVLGAMEGIRSDAYYINMAVAWNISICYIKFPQKTGQWLKQTHIDDFTYNKAIQKITESYRVDEETKDILRGMKRKKIQR